VGIVTDFRKFSGHSYMYIGRIARLSLRWLSFLVLRLWLSLGIRRRVDDLELPWTTANISRIYRTVSLTF